MQLILLGSGTGIPLLDRASPSVAIRLRDQSVLMDLGPGTLRHLIRAGLSWEKIDHILLTHFHPDHTADLIHLLFATRNPSVLCRRTPFHIWGPAGLNRFLQQLRDAYGHWLDLPAEILTTREMPDRESEQIFEHFSIRSRPTRHTDNSIGYRVEAASGKSVVYSGDTGFSEAVIELAKGADLLILEASFPDGYGVEGHLTPYEAGRMAALAGVGRLCLTHFYPESLTADIGAQCRKAYDGELILGRDLLHLHV